MQHLATDSGRSNREQQHNTREASATTVARSEELALLQQTLGNRVLARRIQGKLRVSQTGDPLEREADAAAERVLQRKPSPCSCCSSAGSCLDAGLRKKPPILRKAGGMVSDENLSVPDDFVDRLGAGQPLPPSLRSWAEAGFDRDFSRVRIHTGPSATASARAVDALAYTSGSDIVFDEGRYAPHSEPGRKLLAHELAHVLQQGGQGPASQRLQRTTHGPSTPTNCHNWRIPLPPWIAGTIAHGQISSLLGIPPMAIPRATKLRMGTPSPPSGTMLGFADLWERSTGSVDIAEIKSTATGDAVAHGEAAHYVLRHDEWLTRAPWTDAQDLTYAGVVGSSMPGALLNLLPTTGTDLNLGPFWGDPLKQLHIEGDALGAVLYWCTGAGLPFNPAWYPAFRAAVRRLMDALRRAQQRFEEVVDAVISGIGAAVARVRAWIDSVVQWGLANSRLLAFLLLILVLLVAIVLLILEILGAPETAGGSLAAAPPTVAALAAAAAGILILVGLRSPNLPEATANLASALNPNVANAAATAGEYERGIGGRAPGSPGEAAALQINPSAEFLAALQPLSDPMAVLRGVSQNLTSIPPNGVATLRSGAAALENGGNAATALRIRNWTTAANLA